MDDGHHLPDDEIVVLCPECEGEMVQGHIRASRKGSQLRFLSIRHKWPARNLGGGIALSRYNPYLAPKIEAWFCTRCRVGQFEADPEVTP